jgi:uncharacterized coiled-coil protein SlyX
MKKIILIIATFLLVSTAWAQSQQLLSVKGKTRDGKSINVQYYKGTAQDLIESVKYQVVDELQADNKRKQNTINDLQSQLKQANRRISELEKMSNSGDDQQIDDLNNQLDEKESKIGQLNEQIDSLAEQLQIMRAENERLKKQINSMNKDNLRTSQQESRSGSPVIGVEGSLGSIFLSNNSLNDPWKKTLSWNKQAAIYFGTGSLAEDFPISIEAGVGFRSLPMSAMLAYYENVEMDADRCQYIAKYEDVTEKLTMNCLEVPIRLCIGVPDKGEFGMYTKLGVTPSYILSSSLADAYTKRGYYESWNVTFEDIEELGFFNNKQDDASPVTAGRRFNLWGNAAFGAYLPLGSSLLFNVGAKLDYPILKTGTFEKTNTFSTNVDLPDGLTKYEGRMLISSLQAGFVYTLR